MTFQEILNKLLDNKIDIVMGKGDDGFIWYNLSTMMKSDLLISEQNGKFLYKARYHKHGEFETYEELLRLAVDCMHGRDFANHNWITLLVSEGCLHGGYLHNHTRSHNF
jgi:hypothetical protein